MDSAGSAFPLVRLVLAVALVATLAGRFLTFSLLLPEGGMTIHVAAAASSPVATPGVETTSETLLTTSFAGDWLPSGPATLLLVRIVFDPGVTTYRSNGDFPAGARIDFVVAGTYVVRSEGPLTVLREASKGTPVPVVTTPGTDVTLLAGDAVIHQNNAAEQMFGNHGAEPAVVLFAGITSASLPSPPSGITAGTPDEQLEQLSGPVTLELRPAQLHVGDIFPGPSSGVVQLVVAEPSAHAAPSLGERSDGSIKNVGTEPVALWLLLVTPSGPATLAG